MYKLQFETNLPNYFFFQINRIISIAFATVK